MNNIFGPQLLPFNTRGGLRPAITNHNSKGQGYQGYHREDHGKVRPVILGATLLGYVCGD